MLKSSAMVLSPTTEVLTVGFYNVGIQQTSLENRKMGIVKDRLRKLIVDIVDSFHNHRLDMMAICELGGHTRGLSAKNALPRFGYTKKN